jgi:hypothetical protein
MAPLPRSEVNFKGRSRLGAAARWINLTGRIRAYDHQSVLGKAVTQVDLEKQKTFNA